MKSSWQPREVDAKRSCGAGTEKGNETEKETVLEMQEGSRQGRRAVGGSAFTPETGSDSQPGPTTLRCACRSRHEMSLQGGFRSVK